MDWKNNLLSSSVPLEYEAAKIADSLGFEVDFEYTYSRRNESGIQIDFSVDLFLRKRIYKQSLEALLIIPVECKYRTPDSHWLFLPDLTPEEEQMMNFFSSITAFSNNQQLRYGDTFMLFRCSHKTVRGTEIKGDSVYDKEIRHGIQQLKYSLPQAAIDSLFGLRLDQCTGDCLIIIVPILVTTAGLYIANNDFSINTVQESEDITQLAKETCNLFLLTRSSIDYQMHCKWIMEIHRGLSISKYDEGEEKINVGDYSDALLQSLENPVISVCTLDYFKDFLNELTSYFYNDLELKTNESVFLA